MSHKGFLLRKPIYGNRATKSTVAYLKVGCLVFHFASTSAIYKSMNEISNNRFLVKNDARANTNCSVRKMSTTIFKTHQYVILICICSHKTEWYETTQIQRCAKIQNFVGTVRFCNWFYGTVCDDEVGTLPTYFTNEIKLSSRLKICTASRQILYKAQLRNHHARSNNNFEAITKKFLIISSSGVKELCKLSMYIMYLARTRLKTEAMLNTSNSTPGVHKFFKNVGTISNF
jgi:hypothetical protein